MTINQLHKFMVEVQGEEKATEEDAESTMETILKELKHLHLFHRKSLNLEAFFRYLFSDTNPPIFPSKV